MIVIEPSGENNQPCRAYSIHAPRLNIYVSMEIIAWKSLRYKEKSSLARMCVYYIAAVGMLRYLQGSTQT